MIHLDEGTHLLEKMMDLAPQVVDKIQSMLSKKDNYQKQGNNQNQGNNQYQGGSQPAVNRYQEPKQDIDF